MTMKNGDVWEASLEGAPDNRYFFRVLLSQTIRGHLLFLCQKVNPRSKRPVEPDALCPQVWWFKPDGGMYKSSDIDEFVLEFLRERDGKRV